MSVACGGCCAPTRSTTPATAASGRKDSSCSPDGASRPSVGGRPSEASPMIDLHTHSNRSDGALAPPSSVARAAAAGVATLALTDHDTVAASPRPDTRREAWASRSSPGSRSPRLALAGDSRARPVDRSANRRHYAPRSPTQATRRRAGCAAICAQLSANRPAGRASAGRGRGQAGLPTRAHLARRWWRAAMCGAWRTRSDPPGPRPHRPYCGRLARARGGRRLDRGGRRVRPRSRIRRATPCRRAHAGNCSRILRPPADRSLEVVTGGNAAHHVETCAALAARYGLAGLGGVGFHSPDRPWNTLGRLAKLPAWRDPGLARARHFEPSGQIRP